MPEIGQPMRTVVVVSELGFGGAERQTLDLLAQLRGTPSAPVGVVCLSSNDGRHGDAVRALGYPLSIVPRAGGFDLGRVLALHDLLKEHRADVIHAINWFAGGYALLARPRGTRVIASIRNSHLPSQRLRRLALTRLIGRADGVLVNSDRGRELVASACRVPDARIALVPNGIDVDRLNGRAKPGVVRRELGIPAAAPVVLYVGRHARVKNIPRLLEVTGSLLQGHAEVRVVLAGDGLGPGLVKEGPLAGDPRLFCLGPRDDVPSLMADATLLLLTSDNEGMPNVVLEALVSALPIVATDVGDLARMVPPGCGVLTPRAVAPMTAALLQVIADAAGFRRAVERHVPAIVATYSSQAMARRTVELWKTVLGRTEARAHEEPDHRLKQAAPGRIR